MANNLDLAKKSKENWELGLSLLCIPNPTKVSSATSRLYYGVFQAVYMFAKSQKSYSEERDVNGKKPSIHKKMVDFVRTDPRGGIDEARTLNEMKGYRETADYDPDPPSIDLVKEIVPKCQAIKNSYLKAAGCPI